MIPEYSGVVFAQESISTGSVTSGTVYQDFFLPSDYVRGPQSTEPLIPLLTGFQVAMQSSATNIDLGWQIDHLDATNNWNMLAAGTILQAPITNTLFWASCFASTPITINPLWLKDRFRFHATIVTNVTHLFYTAPNPLASIDVDAHHFDGSPIVTGGASLLFNIMALVVDGDIDILENRYRSIVIPQVVENVDSQTSPGIISTAWRSRPNPSTFAIERLYADISTVDEGPTVFDTILLDPETPGVQFNVYYSSDGDPVVDTADWDNKLWTHVPAVYHATNRDTYYMPRPVTSRYVKIEFTNLQSRQYIPKSDAPIVYDKFPSWVVLYFLLNVAATRVSEDYYIGRQQNVVFDFVNFAYQYYAQDIVQRPLNPPAVLQQVADELQTALQTSTQMDVTTLSQISQNLFPWESAPVLQGTSDFLPGVSASSLGPTSQALNYPTEQGAPSFSPTPLSVSGNYVSSRIKDPLIAQKIQQDMFFYLTCRHAYQSVSAQFQNNRAYFAGVNELAFLRTNFSIPIDTPVYYEVFGDEQNQVTI